MGRSSFKEEKKQFGKLKQKLPEQAGGGGGASGTEEGEDSRG